MKMKIIALVAGLGISLCIFASQNNEMLHLLEGKKNIIPVAIIGSGLAGLTASIPPVRAGYRTVVFAGPKFGGELMDAAVIENWPGIAKTSGADCMHLLEKQVTDLGAKIANLSVILVDLASWPFHVTLSDGTDAYALTLIIATGASQKKRGIEGEEIYWGKGLFSCGICDASFTKDKDTVVIGGSNTAIQRILQLAPVARSITLIVPGPSLTADESMQKRIIGLPNVKQPLYNKEVKKIVGDGTTISSIELMDKQTGQISSLETSSVFLSTKLTPNTHLIKDQLPLDRFGCIQLKSDATQETSIEGVFAAGTVANYHYRQIPVMMGNATKAAMEALKKLAQWGLDGTLRHKNLYHLSRRPPKIKEIKNEKELEEILSNTSNPVLVEFYSSSCSACKHLAPPMGAIAHRFKNVLDAIKVNKKKLPQLFERYNIHIVPTFIFFRQGSETGRMEGVTSSEDLTRLMESEGFYVDPEASAQKP